MNTSHKLLRLRQSWGSWLGSDPDGRDSAWLKIVWTLVFCGFCAVFFTVLGYVLDSDTAAHWGTLASWWNALRINLVVALCIGFAIRALFALGHRVLGLACVQKLSGLPRLLYFNVLPILGVLIGSSVGYALAGDGATVWQILSDPQSVVGSLLFTVSITAGFYLVFSAQARRLQAEKTAAESHLRLLQGQIEPHFLFNTLANVVSLIDYDAPRAKLMLETFTDYLRASLTGLRQDQVSLGSELQLLEHYLNLMQVRMEDRLHFTIDYDPLLRDALISPLLLQPLVENAIHHGLEPQVDGGSIRIGAHLQGSELLIEVLDDGLGLAQATKRPGAGMALANLRDRLQAKYGAQASLVLQAASPGTRVTLRLPFSKDTNA